MQHHPAQVAAGTPCPCGAVCPLCGSGAHDLLCADARHDHAGRPSYHAYLYCTRCSLEFRDDGRLVRYADGDAPYRRVHELLTSIEAVALAANHAPVWRGAVVRCERCGAVGDANDGEAHLNGYTTAFALSRPCTKRP